MSTISKERAQEIFLGNGPEPTASEERELARIALASLEAEPVAWTWEIYGGGNMYAKIKPESLDSRPLYTAPPSPVSVPDDEQGKPHPVMAVKGELGFLDHFDRIISERDEDIDIGQLGSSNYEALMLAALDAFRAAMLQGADGNSPVIAKAYDIEAFGVFSATEGENGLMLQIERFRFGSEKCPQIVKENMVPKFALQAIINRLQAHCNSMGEDTLIDIFASSAAPQQEDK